MLDDPMPRTMPATLEAQKLGSKAAKVGFDWPDSSGLFAKMDEEIAELMVEVEAKHSENVEEEFGDLLFTAMNLARHLHVDSESALRRSNAKFSLYAACCCHGTNGEADADIVGKRTEPIAMRLEAAVGAGKGF